MEIHGKSEIINEEKLLLQFRKWEEKGRGYGTLRPEGCVCLKVRGCDTVSVVNSPCAPVIYVNTGKDVVLTLIFFKLRFVCWLSTGA